MPVFLFLMEGSVCNREGALIRMNMVIVIG